MTRGRDMLIADLRNRIVSGNFKPGQRLASTNVLALEYGITGPTAHRAMKELEREGLLMRRSRSGTFVADEQSLRMRKAMQSGVGVIMEGHAHVHGKVQAHILDELQARGKQVIVINWNSDSGAAGVALQLGDLARVPLRAVIVQRSILEQIPAELKLIAGTGARMIVAFGSPSSVPEGWYSVGPSEEKMNYLAVKHLLDLGHRRIGYLGRQPEKGMRKGDTSDYDAELGIRRAMEEAGAPDSVEFILMPKAHATTPEDTVAWICKALARADRPTALITQMDWKAVLAWRAVGKLGLRVPEDISIVGQWNTPWSEAMELTSVSVHEEIIARHLVELAEAPDTGESNRFGYHVIVDPELIPRKSSAPIPADSASASNPVKAESTSPAERKDG